MKRAFEKAEPVITTSEPIGSNARRSVTKLATNCDELVGIDPVTVCHRHRNGERKRVSEKLLK